MISENESRAIKYIRVGSMLAIVICHILQSYTNHWAFVFNIGVQVFLVLSGYLYGKKNVTDWKKWGVGRLKRVYVPMFLFLIIVLPLYMIFHKEIFSWKPYALNYLNLQGIPFVIGGGMLLGIRHLWFVTAIMFAYLSTPILQWLSKYINRLFPILLLCVGALYVVAPGRLVFAASWVFLYAIGYLHNHLNRRKLYDLGLILLEIAFVLMITMNFDIVKYYFHPLNRAFHDLSGVFIVIIGVKFLSRVKFKNIASLVDLFDKYSFHIFIVHYFIIIGPFSLAHITPYLIVNILFIISTTIVATFLFFKLNNLANRLVFERLLNN